MEDSEKVAFESQEASVEPGQGRVAQPDLSELSEQNGDKKDEEAIESSPDIPYEDVFATWERFTADSDSMIIESFNMIHHNFQVLFSSFLKAQQRITQYGSANLQDLMEQTSKQERSKRLLESSLDSYFKGVKKLCEEISNT